MKMKGWILLLAIAIGGCSKDNTTVVNNVPGNTLSATIGGGYWTATNVQQQLASDTQKIYGDRTPTGSESTVIFIKIANYSGLPGDYPINSTTSAIYTNDNSYYTATGGTVTVSEDNGTHIAGTFSLTLVDTTASLSITGGKFDIKK